MGDPDEKTLSCDRHLTESIPIASSSAEPPDLWRPGAASANPSRPGPSNDLRRIILAPARGGNDRTEASTAFDKPPLNPGPLELPTEYMRQDPHDQVYRLHPPFISSAPTAESSMTLRCQLAQQRTRKNKPHELR
ncbi:hypothetical protein GQ607_007994 [Colletotrichum asianum]|uniref:Uncharacterized protein n=1 Tax=Colletotrichum asianum TaxID=702518 RepID=A0A8H3WBB7_9PEZI|nr:hypothetical protein GQ607_007994 [Colletotrichum asianum]